MPGRTTIIRPGLIVGPDDNTDRFTWWPARAARGGEFIAPGAPADPFQVIDARDLAAFTLNAVEKNITGTYNLVSNVNDFKFGELTDACIASANKQAQPAEAPHATWIPADFLEAQKVEPWSEMPAWLPAKGDEAAFAGTSNVAARAKGLRITPLAKTVDDTLAWHLSAPGRGAREAQGRHRAGEGGRGARRLEVEAFRRLTCGEWIDPPPSASTLRITGLAGAALFAAFFALTYHTPGWVEDFAADYIEAQVAERVDSSIDRIG